MALLEPRSVDSLTRFSTVTKLARTFDKGLLGSKWSEFTGDRPRDGGDVESPFLLLSNLAKRLRTFDCAPDSGMVIV